MAVKMRGGEKWRRGVLHQRLLVLLGRNPENDHILIAFPGRGIDRIRPRIAEEDKRLPTHLVDRIAAGPDVNGDMWHSQGKLVHVLDPGGPALIVRHYLSVGGAAPGQRPLGAAWRGGCPPARSARRVVAGMILIEGRVDGSGHDMSC